mgnify:CR=1 FL=1
MEETTQFKVSDSIMEILLSGTKLEKETNRLDVVNKIGTDLYINNKNFIKEHIPENWYAVIEPCSGKLIASSNQLELYNYTSEKYPNKIFYVIGLLKINFLQYDGTF